MYEYKNNYLSFDSPGKVGRNTRKFAFRSFCNMSDSGRLCELIDEVTMLMYVQGTLYTVFNREMDFMFATSAVVLTTVCTLMVVLTQ